MKALTREKRREKAEKEKQKNWKKGEKGEGKEKETLSAILYYQISYEQIIFRLRPRRRSGLVYFGARYYDPRIGRFITPDPLTWGPDDPRMFITRLSSASLDLTPDRNDHAVQIIKNFVLQIGTMNPKL